ncbi:MAG: ComF family protein [Flavobacteriales bacterium]
MGVISHLLKISFPNNCVTCGNSLLQNEKVLCSNCFFYIPKGEANIGTNNEICSLLRVSEEIIGASHLFTFDREGKTQKLLHELKYSSNLPLGTYLGEQMGVDFKKQLQGIHFIIPVPLHNKKMHERGYNQSEILCRGINKVIKKQISTDNLVRVKYTETQTKKNKQQRIENIKNAFALKNVTEFKGKTVLLVDDVITTGSTLMECIESLKRAEGIQIIVLVLAKANY